MAYCKYCGSELAENASVCPNCGSIVNSASENTQNNAPAPKQAVKKTCLTVAMVFLIITAAFTLISIPMNLIDGVSTLADIDAAAETAVDTYNEFVQMYAEMGIEIEPLGTDFFYTTLTVTSVACIISAICSIPLVAWCIFMAIRCKKFTQKKKLLPFAIITLVLMVVLGGGLIGIAGAILLLCAPKREFEG